MAGDPLDRIEARWRKNAELDPSRYTGALARVADLALREAEDVLALVEVARAARDTGWRDADGLCWCEQAQELTAKPHRPQCLALRAALAWLDEDGSA